MNKQVDPNPAPIKNEERFVRLSDRWRRVGTLLVLGFLCWALSQWQTHGDVQAPALVVLKAAAIYFFILLIFRISGKRTLAETSAFDLVLLLILSESIQGALIGQDSTLMTAFIAISTFVFVDMMFSYLKEKFQTLDKVLDDVPVLLYADGQFHRENMKCERINLDDILDAARAHHGVYRMDQIRYAILERNGKISIISKNGV